ncbi:TetR/AcrR family transcriptional regulator [Paenarthrobacter sp. YAF11_1]|uniref:TetR/AcrR family transcriptional regulator n=1 Tax=Paenarthrobacter sp. YAF11_1 TaxID=3233074 RepID=UPI003F9CF344
MAWDTERTKRLLLRAATTEFCDRGLAGARIDRIASEAGVNKERIYQYFGNKSALFDAVIVSAISAGADDVRIEGIGPEAIADYAGRLFDCHQRDATAPRLLFWEGLERGVEVVGLSARVANFAPMVGGIQSALPGTARQDAADLLITILSLCGAWTVLPGLDRLISGVDPDLAWRRRAVIMRTVRLGAEAIWNQSGPVAAVIPNDGRSSLRAGKSADQ